MKTSPIINNLNAGELSPLLAGRTDIKSWPHGLKYSRNFIPSPQGPVRRRPGTKFVAEVKNSAARTWLSKFQFSADQVYVLEWGQQYVRFYANHIQLPSGFVPLEVAMAYITGDLTDADGCFRLRFAQSGDVLYIAHRSYDVRKLIRTGGAAFMALAVLPEGGPFEDIDPDNIVTVWASAKTGVVTLTASANIFVANDVGTLFFLEQQKVDNIKAWEPAKAIAINDLRRSDGKTYKALTAANTGAVKPVHSEGAAYDGDAGVQWQFQDAGFGWGLITAIGGGGATATMSVVTQLPTGTVGAPEATTRWAKSSWGPGPKWPDNVKFWRERLVFSRHRMVWASEVGLYDSFRALNEGGLISAEMAVRSDTISDTADPIRWLMPDAAALLIGTGGDEQAYYEMSPSEPFGPGNATVRSQTSHGSRGVEPLRIGEGIVFLSKDGRKLRDFHMAESVNERWVASDLTILAEHISKAGIVSMAYQQDPDSIIWTATTEGKLLGFTLNREQEIRGWHQHRIGGNSDIYDREPAVVECVQTIPSPNRDRDEVWMIVRRNISGVTKRYVEYMEKMYEQGDDPHDAFYMDSGMTQYVLESTPVNFDADLAAIQFSTNVQFTAPGLFDATYVGKEIHYRYYNYDVEGKRVWKTAIARITGWVVGNTVSCTIDQPFPPQLSIAPGLGQIPVDRWSIPTHTMTGLNHLLGETVEIIADGIVCVPQVVGLGGIVGLFLGTGVTTPISACKIHAGLACHAVLQPMPLDPPAPTGSGQGKTQRVDGVIVRVHETGTFQVGRTEDSDNVQQIEFRLPENPMDEAVPLFTGDKYIDWPGGYERNSLLTFVANTPEPATFVAIIPSVSVEDK